MRVEKLSTVDAFVVFDLEEADRAVGITRLAPRVLVDGATWLARSQTYQFASFEVRAGGASAGINARGDGRDTAVAAFVTEVTPWVSSQRFATEPGKGLERADLEPLIGIDPRGPSYFDHREALVAVGLCAATEAACGSIEGRSFALEGFERGGATIAASLRERGARIVAVSTASGTVTDPAGLAVEQLTESWEQHGAAFVEHLGGETAPASAVLGAEADVLLVGSRAGVIDHDAASSVTAGWVVPSGPVPVTAKALAVLGRAGTTVLPDFITTAGALPAGAGEGERSFDDLRTAAAESLTGVLHEVLAHEGGPFLGACLRAEAFLRTWCEDLPFGRPLS
jgi:glutamate dehydrogenase/leucine dehydrogenase